MVVCILAHTYMSKNALLSEVEAQLAGIRVAWSTIADVIVAVIAASRG